MEHFLQTQAFQAFVAEAQRKSFTSNLFHVLACPPVPYTQIFADVPSAGSAASAAVSNAFPRETVLSCWQQYESGALVELENAEQRNTLVLPGPTCDITPLHQRCITCDGADSCLFPRFQHANFATAPQYQKLLQVLELSIRAQPALPELYILRADVYTALYVEAKRKSQDDAKNLDKLSDEQRKRQLAKEPVAQHSMRKMLEAALTDYGTACHNNPLLANTAKLEESFSFVVEELKALHLSAAELEKLVSALPRVAYDTATRFLDSQDGHRWVEFAHSSDSDSTHDIPAMSESQQQQHQHQQSTTSVATQQQVVHHHQQQQQQSLTLSTSANPITASTNTPLQNSALSSTLLVASANGAASNLPKKRDHDKPLAASDISWIGITATQVCLTSHRVKYRWCC
jgi:hypothetical protein